MYVEFNMTMSIATNSGITRNSAAPGQISSRALPSHFPTISLFRSLPLLTLLPFPIHPFSFPFLLHIRGEREYLFQSHSRTLLLLPSYAFNIDKVSNTILVCLQK